MKTVLLIALTFTLILLLKDKWQSDKERYGLRLKDKWRNEKAKKREASLLDEKGFVACQKALGLDFLNGTKPFAEEHAKRLEAAFPLSYQVNVYNRMVKETAYSERQIFELLFEQKRFLLMASLLKKVPMFSKDVDEVWHQMLMFTHQYKAFTEAFAGQFIHHEPNIEGTDGEDDKFYFAMMYKELFYEKDFSENAWGFKFFEERPTRAFVREWETSPESILKNTYFFDTPVAQTLAQTIVSTIKKSIRASQSSLGHALFSEQRGAIRSNKSNRTSSGDNIVNLPYALWVATYDTSNYSEALGHAPVSSGKGSSSSQSCGSSGGGGSSCGSSGGSSCGSSCGSGCGSS